MKRNLTGLGLSLAAVLLIGAISASAAFAQQQGSLTTDGEKVTLDATEIGESGENALTAFGAKVECPESFYAGHKVDATPHEMILNGSGTATFTPTYTNCVSVSGESEFPSTVQMNGCDYVMHIGQTTPPSNEVGTYGLTADLVCEEGQEVEIESFLGGSHGFRVCTDRVPPQENLTGLHITNTPKSGKWGHDDLHVTGTLHSIEATQSGLCGAAESTECELHLNITVEGTNAAQEGTGITVTDK